MIRPAEPADEPAIRTLQAELPHADPGVVDAAFLGPFLARVAVDGGVVGYAIALPGRPATLSELVVAPDRRREGYGRALVASVAAATDAGELAVTTPAGATGVRRFYDRLGFAPEERLPGFYADGSDALRLVRRE